MKIDVLTCRADGTQVLETVEVPENYLDPEPAAETEPEE